MSIYHIDKSYGSNDKMSYNISPYNLKGTLLVYFSRSFSYLHWTDRFKNFFSWIKYARFSLSSAQRLCDKLNSKSVKG